MALTGLVCPNGHANSPEHTAWHPLERYEKQDEFLIYETNTGKPARMPSTNRLVHFAYSRLMSAKNENFTSLARYDNPVLIHLLSRRPINPGQLICMEMLRWMEKCSAKSKLPFPCVVTLLLQRLGIKALERHGNRRPKLVGTKTLKDMGLLKNLPASAPTAAPTPSQATQFVSQEESESINAESASHGPEDETASTGERPRTISQRATLAGKSLSTSAAGSIGKPSSSIRPRSTTAAPRPKAPVYTQEMVSDIVSRVVK